MPGRSGGGDGVELRPGVFTAGFAKVDAEGLVKGRLGLEELAKAVEKRARANASKGRHARGTPTPARPGSGPAVITGTLKRSVDHSAIAKDASGWSTKVGPRTGMVPPGGSTTAADRYGYFLETGLVNGVKYPWLKPAAEFACRVNSVTIFTKMYGAGWKRIF